MLLFIEIIVGLGLVAFPIIMAFFKGTVDYSLYWGVVFGFHYDVVFFQVKEKDGTETNFRLNLLQFHLCCITILLKFSRKTDRQDLERHE